jgi:hypothetical protein
MEESSYWLQSRGSFFPVLLPFQIIARLHDEATTSDYGSDIVHQYNIVTSADEHGHNAQKENDHT